MLVPQRGSYASILTCDPGSGFTEDVSSTDGTSTISCPQHKIHGPFGLTLPGGTILVLARIHETQCYPVALTL
ncbi:hypothetical protein AGR2A_pa40005 [Agrobacterium genomosp. 2 str. CFBP 5494]|uniref:Uncharacterized protein n=1 Tax=Agrobacterium genomosp. 2 str. CFBP 5494 TaxID=1183436 RepID=A0A9W5B6J2_9HYPH|nr:hypothetical protein AGR2A_pa40005 [Agrobacterium genomosp. 2 str. CFBP 5494]